MQVFTEKLNLVLILLSILCIVTSTFSTFILFNYFSSIPTIKKNTLTRLDEVFVLQLMFFIFCQCSVCLFSLVFDWRNDFLYLAFFIIIYFNMAMVLSIVVALSFCRVLIIHRVSLKVNRRRRMKMVVSFIMRG